MKSDIGLIGLAVMGENLVLNMESKGFAVSVFNRSFDKTETFLGGRANGKNIKGFETLNEFVESLSSPRKIMIMVKAGSAVDDVINSLIPLLDKGDVIIDGGNSNFDDSIRRTSFVESKGLLFVGSGVSGGEEGALHGPSLMPGGSFAAWDIIKPIFQKIAAKAPDGTPCCDWVGENGSGHFVKMVHNGIEYGDMQLIAEAYSIMKNTLGLSGDEMADIFDGWNKGTLDSYLVEITANILRYKDSDGLPILEKILDTAGQKGTGKWTGISALNLGVPLTLIAESVFARCLSSQKDERVKASTILNGPKSNSSVQDKKAFIDDLEKSLYAAKIVSYAQGYVLMREAAIEQNWNLNYGGIAMIWRGGCIIRSAFLGKIKEAFDKNKDLTNLMIDPFFAKIMNDSESSLRRVAAFAITNGIAIPSTLSALEYFDGYRTANGSANMLQAQRDYFGAHTYERIDKSRGEFFHTDWTGHGGNTTSTAYNK